MTDMDAAPPASPPTPSQSADGGFNSSDARGYFLWALSYGVASAIALRTIDALTCKPRANQHETDDEKQKEKEKTSTPTICQVVFPSVSTIINSENSSTLVTKKEEVAASTSQTTFQRGKETAADGPVNKKEDAAASTSKTTFQRGKETAADGPVNKKEEAAASTSKTTFQCGKESFADRAIGVADRALGIADRALGRFSRPKPRVPTMCKHLLDFYSDCRYSYTHYSYNSECEPYADMMKKCRQIEEIQNSKATGDQSVGPTSTNISNISNPPIIIPPALLLRSYTGCKERKERSFQSPASMCKKYAAYVSIYSI